MPTCLCTCTCVCMVRCAFVSLILCVGWFVRWCLVARCCELLHVYVFVCVLVRVLICMLALVVAYLRSCLHVVLLVWLCVC